MNAASTRPTPQPAQTADQAADHVDDRAAHRAAAIYRAIVDLLPVSVTVQDAAGQLVLANSCAGKTFGIEPVSALHPAGPAVSGASATAVVCGEQTVSTPVGDLTLLTSQRHLTIAETTLLLSTSVDITARKEQEQELLLRATVDELTGLANRTTIEQRVEQTLSEKLPGERFALVFIDLDNFKHVNDYYSHAIGDGLLIEVARRLSAELRSTDMLARISGDEFVLLIDPVVSNAGLRNVIDNCLSALKRPYYLEGFEIFTSGSIGVSVFPDHGKTYELLRRNADSAMYRAKDGAKGEAVYFDSDLGTAVTARMALEQQLRLAIRDRHFRCAFQPKVDLRTQEVVGFETLIRWRDHQGTIHSPTAFIGLAVEFGLIDPITNFVVEQSAGALDQLDKAYGPGRTISVNVAAKQASDSKFMASFVDTLKNTGRADRFMVELTEDAFIGKGRFQTEFLPALRDLGVKVSIDDFGTGYSSLSVLSDITADELKIDRSFVTDIHQRPRSQSILRAIESLGHSLGMSIVAEGVESFEELAYLQTATRIRYAQGFYFAKPFHLDEFTVASTLPGGGGREVASTRATTSARSLPLLGRSA
jgi:diguanylate cyclase (GGDEF)-like protein